MLVKLVQTNVPYFVEIDARLPFCQKFNVGVNDKVQNTGRIYAQCLSDVDFSFVSSKSFKVIRLQRSGIDTIKYHT